MFAFVFDSWPAMCIHGDKHQSEREWVLGGMKLIHPSFVTICVLVKIATLCHFLSFLCLTVSEFRGGKSPILIATDVASRGLGIDW